MHAARRIRSKLTFANVTSVIALLVALGGTATAQGTFNGKLIKDNTVSSRKVKNYDLANRDFKNGAVRSNTVLNGSLDTGDLSSLARETLRGASAKLHWDGSKMVVTDTVNWNAFTVTRGQAGMYCIDTPPFTIDAIQATPSIMGSGVNDAAQVDLGGGGSCGVLADAIVENWDVKNGVLEEGDVYVQVWGH